MIFKQLSILILYLPMFFAPVFAQEIGDLGIYTTNIQTGSTTDFHLSNDQQSDILDMIAMQQELSAELTFNNNPAPADTNCCYAVNIYAVPQTVNVRRGTLGSTDIHWFWNTINGFNGLKYGCLYVQNSVTGVWAVVQCENKGTYTTHIPWIQGGINYPFRVAIQSDTATHNPPLFIAGTLPGDSNAVTVVGVAQ